MMIRPLTEAVDASEGVFATEGGRAAVWNRPGRVRCRLAVATPVKWCDGRRDGHPSRRGAPRRRALRARNGQVGNAIPQLGKAPLLRRAGQDEGGREA